MAETLQGIPAHYQVMFDNNINLNSQQMDSLIGDRVWSAPASGEIKYIDYYPEVAAVKNNSRLPKSPHIEIQRRRRQVTPNRYQFGNAIDRLDIEKLARNPQDPIFASGAAALARTKDDVIIDALGGNAVAVNEDKTTSNVALPAAQKVGVQVGSPSGAPVDCGMNETKVLKARQIIGEGKVDIGRPDNKLYGLISSKAVFHDLLSRDKVVSSDFNSTKPLVDGMLMQWLGIEWVITERLLDDANGDALCYVYAKSGIHLAVWEELYFSVKPRGDLSDSPYIYMEKTIDAVRTEEAKVVQIAIDKTATATGA